MKSYPYGNASREKTVKAARLKIFEIIDKSLSQLLKKTANQKFLSFIDSKKRIFRQRRANGVAPTVSTETFGSMGYSLLIPGQIGL